MGEMSCWNETVEALCRFPHKLEFLLILHHSFIAAEACDSFGNVLFTVCLHRFQPVAWWRSALTGIVRCNTWFFHRLRLRVRNRARRARSSATFGACRHVAKRLWEPSRLSSSRRDRLYDELSKVFAVDGASITSQKHRFAAYQRPLWSRTLNHKRRLRRPKCKLCGSLYVLWYYGPLSIILSWVIVVLAMLICRLISGS